MKNEQTKNSGLGYPRWEELLGAVYLLSWISQNSAQIRPKKGPGLFAVQHGL